MNASFHEKYCDSDEIRWISSSSKNKNLKKTNQLKSLPLPRSNSSNVSDSSGAKFGLPSKVKHMPKKQPKSVKGKYRSLKVGDLKPVP